MGQHNYNQNRNQPGRVPNINTQVSVSVPPEQQAAAVAAKQSESEVDSEPETDGLCEVFIIPDPVAAQFDRFLALSVANVVFGKITIVEAKHQLKAFFETLPQEEKMKLYQNNTGMNIAARVKNYAESIAQELPLLFSQMG